MDKELLEQFRMLAEGMAQMEERLLDKMATKEELRAAESRIKIYIENAVTDKIRALFDGYQSALENQALLKVKMQVALTFACMNLKKLANWKHRGGRFSTFFLAFYFFFSPFQKKGAHATA